VDALCNTSIFTRDNAKHTFKLTLDFESKRTHWA